MKIAFNIEYRFKILGKFMAWDERSIEILKTNWKTKTASQIAELIGGVSRNAVIGKANRLNLSAKIKTR